MEKLLCGQPVDPVRPLLTGDAMSPHRQNIRNRKKKIEIGRWLLVSIFYLLFSVSAYAGDARRTPIVEAVERARAAVVNIHSERTVMGPASEELFSLSPSQNRINGMGTGVLVDPRGYIVTNHHVVEDVHVIRVRLGDSSTYSARVLARDPDADLALLKIDAGRPLPVMPMGTGKDLMVGETVIAIGNAYGYEHTVTVGVVSALHRDVVLNKEISYKGLIQTDASINPGNSGGPLLNINGDMVGVNVAIRAGAQGISFAIPVDSMISAVADMMSIRKRQGLWHGLVCADRVETDGGRELKGEGRDKETLISRLSSLAPRPSLLGEPHRFLIVDRIETGSPAARAGLQPEDVVIKVADLRISSSLDLERALLDHLPGDHVPLVVRRKGEEQRLDLVLQSLEPTAPPTADLVWTKLGLRLGAVSTEMVTRTNPQLHGGMIVVDVRAASMAAKAGIQRGDILVGLHTWETLTIENVGFVLHHPDLPNLNPLAFYIIRSGQLRKGWMQQAE
jgi:serine protease Do